MKKLFTVVSVAVFAAVASLQAQTSTNPVSPIATVSTNIPATVQQALSMSPLQLLESYVVDNDTNYNGWASNHFSLWQGAVFANVNGVAGASSIGNDMGLEVPIHKYNISIDSVTRFEQFFGDIHAQQLGVHYDYNLNQLQLSAGLDGRYTFTGGRLQAVPYVELKKASTLLHGLGTILRYGYPISGHSGAGEIELGAVVSF